MSVTPLHQFDVYISKHVDADVFTAWKATINRSSFPNVNLSNDKEQTYHLDEDKYKNSFSLFLQLCDSLPSKLFDYVVSIDGDNVVITGLTETTVRVAIVDLVTSQIPNASVKLVRPPTNFRVYAPTQAVQSEDIGGISSIFGGDDGDY
jgi:hypothetical protein